MRDHPEGRPALAGTTGGDEQFHHQRTPEPLLVSEREAAALLSVSARHLEQLRRAGSVPHRRLGHRVLYSPSELREWVERGCPSAGGAEGEA